MIEVLIDYALKMTIYSKRLKLQAKNKEDIFRYDSIPEKLVNQLIFNLRDLDEKTIEFTSIHGVHISSSEIILKNFQEEHGINIHDELENLSLYEVIDASKDDILNVLDLIEIAYRESCKIRDATYLPPNFFVITNDFQEINKSKAKDIYTKQINDIFRKINLRFRESLVGFDLINGQFIRIDQNFVHKEAVIPVLTLLAGNRYSGINAEFLKAHDYFIRGDYTACVVECAKAFESTMKVILKERSAISDKESNQFSATKLVNRCKENQLFPAIFQANLNHLVGILSDGIPPLRNQEGYGHGRGNQIMTSNESLASYCLNITAANIKFLFECHSKKNKRQNI